MDEMLAENDGKGMDGTHAENGEKTEGKWMDNSWKMNGWNELETR